MFDNMEWRPMTFTDLQVQSGFDQQPSQLDHNFDIFSNNKPQNMGLESNNSNKFMLSPEPLLSANESPNKNKSFKDKIFAEKIFKNINKKKGNSSFYMKSNLDGRKLNKNKMMDSIIEQNENNQLNKPKFRKTTGKSFFMTNNTLMNLKKKPNVTQDSTAIPININDKKKHMFNSTFNIQSKQKTPNLTSQPNSL